MSPRFADIGTDNYPEHEIWTLSGSLANLLAVPIWSDKKYLEHELQRFQNSESTPSNLSRYIYQCILRLVIFVPAPQERSSNCPEWIQNILKLAVFPITNPDQSHDRGALHDRTFVPDSPLLNKILSTKVRLLDFRGEDVSKLFPLLRWANSSLSYLSTYDDEKYLQIEGQESIYTEAMDLLSRSKKYDAR